MLLTRDDDGTWAVWDEDLDSLLQKTAGVWHATGHPCRNIPTFDFSGIDLPPGGGPIRVKLVADHESSGAFDRPTREWLATQIADLCVATAAQAIAPCEGGKEPLVVQLGAILDRCCGPCQEDGR